MDTLNGRSLYKPQGLDPYADLNLLVDAIAASDANLFDMNGRPVWLQDTGKLVQVSGTVLHEICTKYVVTKRLRNLGDPDHWEVNYVPVELTDAEIRRVLSAKTREEGGLVFRLPKA